MDSLNKMLQGFGQAVVNPNGSVTGMLNGDQAAAIAEAERMRKLKEAQELARQKSLMEAAAAQPKPVPAGPQALSPYNPFVILFGQPNDPDSKGLLGR